MMNEVIEFNGKFDSHVVGVVDIIESTKITALLNKPKVCQYYSIFLNSMANIITKHNGIVVKNIGDSLLYYFPKETDMADKKEILNSLECGMEMVDAHAMINSSMRAENLPIVNYRISSDHGMIMTAKSANSINEDIFGPTVNICMKINHAAKPNNMVIGGDLYQQVKSLEKYRFEPTSAYHNGLKVQYPVYSINRSTR